MTSVSLFPQSATSNSSTYYVYDYSKLSFAEIWQKKQLNPFRILLLTTILASKLRGLPRRTGVPRLYDNLKQIKFNEIPESVLRDITPAIRSFESTGYEIRYVQTATQAKGNIAYGAQMLSADRLSIAGISFARVTVDGYVQTNTNTGIVTHRQNGHVLATSNSPERLKAPPEFYVKRFVGAPPEHLVARHRQRLLNCPDALVLRDDELAERSQAFARRFVELQVARGFFVPANSEELHRDRDKVITPGVFEVE